MNHRFRGARGGGSAMKSLGAWRYKRGMAGEFHGLQNFPPIETSVLADLSSDKNVKKLENKKTNKGSKPAGVLGERNRKGFKRRGKVSEAEAITKDKGKRQIYEPEATTWEGTVVGDHADPKAEEEYWKRRREASEKNVPISDEDFAHKMSGWIANDLDKDHFKLLYQLIHDDPNMEFLVTPFPVAEKFAEWLDTVYAGVLCPGKFERSKGKLPGWRFSMLDPMTGTGADSLAVIRKFPGKVLVQAHDLDPDRLKMVRRAFEIMSKDSRMVECIGKKDLIEWKDNVAKNWTPRDVSSLYEDAKNNRMDPVDMVYLDPVWPGTSSDKGPLQSETIRNHDSDQYVGQKYEIGKKHEMFDFIDHLFSNDKQGFLKLVACKIFKKAWYKDYMQGKVQELRKKNYKVDFRLPGQVQIYAYQKEDGKIVLKKNTLSYKGDVAYIFIYKNPPTPKLSQMPG